MSGQFLRQGTSRWDGSSKKGGPQSIGKSRGGWTTKIHLVAAGPDCPLIFHLSPGNAHDGPEGRKLIERLRELLAPGCKLLMDKAYCGAATRRLAE